MLRGPNAVPWGSQAIGGVVNIVTEQPTDGLQGRAQRRIWRRRHGLFANAGIAGGSGACHGALTARLSAHRRHLRLRQAAPSPTAIARYGAHRAASASRCRAGDRPRSARLLCPQPGRSRWLSGARLTRFADDRANIPRRRKSMAMPALHADLPAAGSATASPSRSPTSTATITIRRRARAVAIFGRGRSERYEYQGDCTLVDQLRLVAGAEHEDSRLSSTAATILDAGITSFYGEAIVTPIDGADADRRRAQRRSSTRSAAIPASAPMRRCALTTGTTLRGSYARRLQGADAVPAVTRRITATPTLEPETARSYDVGVEQSLLGGRAACRRDLVPPRYQQPDRFRSAAPSPMAISRAPGPRASSSTLALRPIER